MNQTKNINAPTQERIELPEAVKNIAYTVFMRAKGQANLTEQNDWFSDTLPHLAKWWRQALEHSPMSTPSPAVADKLDGEGLRVTGFKSNGGDGPHRDTRMTLSDGRECGITPSLSKTDIQALNTNANPRPSSNAALQARIDHLERYCNLRGINPDGNNCVAELRQAIGKLIEIGAECHRAKWKCDTSGENQIPAKEARRLVGLAFDDLHRIGDIAIKAKDSLQVLSAPQKHECYFGFDKDAPAATKDRNGEVVLACCKRCGLGESQLDDNPVCIATPPVTDTSAGDVEANGEVTTLTARNADLVAALQALERHPMLQGTGYKMLWTVPEVEALAAHRENNGEVVV